MRKEREKEISMMNWVSSGSARTSVVKNVAVLFVLALVALAWVATPLIAFASPNDIIAKAPLTLIPNLPKNKKIPNALLVGRQLIGTEKIVPATVKSLKLISFIVAIYQHKILRGMYLGPRKGTELLGDHRIIVVVLRDPPQKAISSPKTISCVPSGSCRVL
jgi:hypothetical protein